MTLSHTFKVLAIISAILLLIVIRSGDLMLAKHDVKSTLVFFVSSIALVSVIMFASWQVF